ncbi:hypothetical protein E2C01_071920 [Portunus trituberculatus]|uniref:Uncharacterized protein n=1 Tax=Portunus trituberculatus TaxID=210409 RepID=A0A5B7I6D2_PORTR|nr:hypothetical protein [Portunus trituberculatus]
MRSAHWQGHGSPAVWRGTALIGRQRN